MKQTILYFLVFLISFSSLKAEEKQIPLFEKKPVQALVQDYAQFLTKEQDKKIQKKLIKLSNETSTQILFVTVNSLMGYDKNDYATRLGEAWGVGGKEDNGIVILVQPKVGNAKGEIAIQVGYGLEGIIPDIVAKRIVEHEIIPNFKNGKYFRGIDAAIDVITDISKGQFTADKYLERNKSRKSSEGSWTPFISIILFAIIFGIMRIRGARQYSIGHNVPFWIAMGMMSSSGGSSGGGFSNFSSGGGSFGGGGFGGFGGGSFGGGGAGGSW